MTWAIAGSERFHCKPGFRLVFFEIHYKLGGRSPNHNRLNPNSEATVLKIKGKVRRI